MTATRLGIVGLGNMGRNHLRIAASMRGVELVGGHDTNIAAGRDICQKNGTAFFSELDDLAAAVDAVVVAAPTLRHFDLAERFLKRGIHVFVEKPLAATAREAALLGEIAAKAQLVLQVGHVERFSPVFTELQKILQTEKVLAITTMRMSPFAQQAADVSVTYDLLIHDLDILCALFQIKRSALANLPISAFGFSKGADTMNYVDVHAVLPGQILAHLTASKITMEKVRQYLITCEKSYIVADFLAKSIQICRHQNSTYVGDAQVVKYQQASLVERVMVPNVEPLFAEVSDFVSAIQNKRAAKVTAEDGVLALEFADRVEALAKKAAWSR